MSKLYCETKEIKKLATGRATTALCGGRVHFCDPQIPRHFRLKTAPGYGRDYRNVITFLDGRGFLLQVADVFIVKVNIHKRAQLAVIGVQMPSQIGMLHRERIHGLGHGRAFNLNGGLLAHILPQRRWNVNFAHRINNIKDAAASWEDST
jgi:hypothetical protein